MDGTLLELMNCWFRNQISVDYDIPSIKQKLTGSGVYLLGFFIQVLHWTCIGLALDYQNLMRKRLDQQNQVMKPAIHFCRTLQAPLKRLKTAHDELNSIVMCTRRGKYKNCTTYASYLPLSTLLRCQLRCTIFLSLFAPF